MSNAQRLGDVLGGIFAEPPFKKHLDAKRVLEAWPEVVGAQISGMTEVQRLHGGKLFVAVSSAPWRHVLHLQREQWREKLNELLGEKVVEEIVFR